MTKLMRFGWFVLAYNLFVIVFGAFVRATGSGAGCGSHWPTCQGAIIPRAPAIETIIEYTHRITSGLTIVFIVALVIWTWRTYPRGSALRKTSGAAFAFIVVESLLGAGLVIFNLVLNDASLVRAFAMMAHLVNTFLLIGSLTLNAIFLTFGTPQGIRADRKMAWFYGAGVVAFFVLGASGAIAALGDTLYPSQSLLEGVRQDFVVTSNYLVRLRIYHPLIAVITCGYAIAYAFWARRKLTENNRLRIVSTGLIALALFQLCLGAINVVLLAPVWLQLVHLFITCLLWIGYLMTGIFSLITGYLPLRVVDQKIDNRIHQPAT